MIEADLQLPLETLKLGRSCWLKNLIVVFYWANTPRHIVKTVSLSKYIVNTIILNMHIKLKIHYFSIKAKITVIIWAIIKSLCLCFQVPNSITLSKMPERCILQRQMFRHSTKILPRVRMSHSSPYMEVRVFSHLSYSSKNDYTTKKRIFYEH